MNFDPDPLEDVILRTRVYSKLSEWGVIYGAYDHLMGLLGTTLLDVHSKGLTDSQRSLCRKLAGPYGKVIYKMLMIRKRAKHLK